MKSALEQVKDLSYKLLSKARTQKKDYDSLATRRVLSDSVTVLCPAIIPYGWQIDLAEALALGLDATVIAGAGSGKTLPWAMPLLLERTGDKICLVISPLNELEADHARFFTEKLKIPAVVMNRDTWNAREGSIQKDVRDKLYRIILTSSEMCISGSGFAALLSTTTTNQRFHLKPGEIFFLGTTSRYGAEFWRIGDEDDLLEGTAGWDYVGKYGHEVLSLLEGADHEHQLEAQERGSSGAQPTFHELVRNREGISPTQRV